MKKLIGPSIFTLTLLFSLPSMAGSPNQNDPGFYGDIGLEGLYYRYREESNNIFIMGDKGAMYGVYYIFGYQPACMPVRFALDGHIDGSKRIRYTSNRTGSMNNSSYLINEFRFLGTYSYDLQNEWALEGYSGLGIRNVINDDRNKRTTTGHVGYYRHSSYAYIPIGFNVIRDCHYMQWIAHLEYDWFLTGKQSNRFSWGSVENKQKHGCGFRMGLDFLIPSSLGCFDYRIGAFLRYWNIEDSSHNPDSRNIDIWHEPPNTTTELGLRFGLSF